MQCEQVTAGLFKLSRERDTDELFVVFSGVAQAAKEQ